MSKGRSSADSTPKRNGIIKDTDLTEDKDVTPLSMPNVRLEAKMADEEYPQKYSGKLLHPFFSLWKESKRHQVIGDVLRGSDQATAPPSHVFERDEDGAASLDWTNWELHEKPFADSACTVEDRHLLQGELLNEESAIVSSNSSDVHGICCQLITDMTTDCKPDESGLFGAQVMVENVEETGVLQHERVIADCLNGESQVDNRLWTDKYQPKIAREVSTSECRNGTGVRRRFGETLGSQFFKRSVESPVKPLGGFMKFSFTPLDYEVMQEHENKLIDFESKADKHNIHGLTETCGKSDNKTKTSILFEDVDVIFPQDSGFISAIQNIADNAKGPFILTSNSDNPVLPEKLDRLYVNFKMPARKDLLQHVYKVCSSEQSYSEPHIIEKIVECCHGDIRKVIMHAQFWCQGKQFRETETKIDDETRLSVDQVTSTLEEVPVTNGFDLNLSSVEEDLDDCISESYRVSEILESTCDQLLLTSSHQEIEDSQTDFMGVVAGEYQLMDECSRIDFNKKCPMAAAQLGWLDEADMVRETWRKLRHRYSDLKHLSVSEDENASGIVRLACAMSNHVSDAEMLFSECYLPGSSELFTALSEVSETFSWHARQREMVSNIVQHGFGCYVDDINGLRLKMGSHDKVNLTWAMLSIGSMVEADSSSMFQDPSERVIAHSEPDRTSSLSGGGGLAKSANQSHILDIVRSVVPSRSYSTIKGESFQEYLSALSHISRSEVSRLSEQGNSVARRRRTRASQQSALLE